MKQTFQFVLVAFVFATSAVGQTVELNAPVVVLKNIPFTVPVSISRDRLGMESYSVVAEGVSYPIEDVEEVGWAATGVQVDDVGPAEIALTRLGQTVDTAEIPQVPGWLSILPPFIAIFMALVFKRVIPSLFAGIWFGAMLAAGISISGAWSGLLDTFQIFVLGALADEDHAAIILFSFMIGGMVGIISKNGGMQGVVNKIVTWAKSPQRGQIATGVLGVAIFFDDYANSLVVGNTMRSVTDKLKISREKLAYIVDSTAAPVACVALVTTWIGFEVGLIDTALKQLPDIQASAYELFLSSIAYSFYPLLAVFFVFLVASTRRDFGPMYKAELRARTTGQVLAPDAEVDEAASKGEELKPVENKPHRAVNAVIPVLVLIFGVMGGLYATGSSEEATTIRDILRDANSYTALMWASLLGVVTAAVLSISQKILSIGQVVESWYSGLKAMMFAMIILVLAWSLSEVTSVVHTAPFLVSILGEALNPGFVPAIVFILSAATAFATGSSWGSMGILLPLVMPLTWAVMVSNGMTDLGSYHILYSSVACILAGSVWGDHCSPISDTTILSSMASGCDHLDHVRTQLPYALLVGSVAILIGTIPAGFGFPWWLSLIIGASLLVACLKYFGKSADDAVSASAEPIVVAS